jgi:hypothetical protein
LSEEKVKNQTDLVTNAGNVNEPNPAFPNPGRHILVYTRPLWDVTWLFVLSVEKVKKNS